MTLPILDIFKIFIYTVNQTNELLQTKDRLEKIEKRSLKERFYLSYTKLSLKYNFKCRLPYLKKQLLKANRNNISMVCKSPSKLPNISFEYIEYIIEVSKRYNVSIDFIIYKTLKNIDMIVNLFFHRSIIDPDLVSNYVIIIKSSMKYFTYNGTIDDKYKDKWITIKFDRSLENLKDTIEFSIVDSESKESIDSSNPVYTKYFELSNGEIYNTNYSISKDLRDEDYKLYTAIASTIVFIFSIIIENTMNIEKAQNNS